MSSVADRLRLLQDHLAAYESNVLSDVLATEKSNAAVPTVQHAVSKKRGASSPMAPGSKTRSDKTLMHRTQNALAKPPPKLPPPVYESRAVLQTNYPQIRRQNFIEAYKLTDLQLQDPRGTDSVAAKPQPSAPHLLNSTAQPQRNCGAFQYKDITVGDIESQGLYNLVTRGDIPADADLSPAFFHHPADSKPIMASYILSDPVEVLSASDPRIREDVPRYFGSLKLDYRTLLHSDSRASKTERLYASIATDLHKLQRRAPLASPDAFSDDIDRYKLSTAKKPIVPVLPLEEQKNSEAQNARDDMSMSSSNDSRDLPTLSMYDRRQGRSEANLLHVDSHHQPDPYLYSARIFSDMRKEREKLLLRKDFAQSIDRTDGGHGFLLCYDLVTDFSIPVSSGRILRNTNVFNALMMQYSFVASRMAYLLDKLQRVFSSMKTFEGTINGNELIKMALSTYFQPFCRLDSIHDIDVVQLVSARKLSEAEAMRTIAVRPVNIEGAVLSIQSVVRGLTQRRRYTKLVVEKDFAIVIQKYARRLLATKFWRREHTTFVAMRLSIRLARQSALMEQLKGVCSVLEDFTRYQPSLSSLHVRSVFILDIAFWKNLFKCGFVVRDYLFVVVFATRPPRNIDIRYLLNNGSSEVSLMFGAADYTLLIDPRIVLFVVGDSDFEATDMNHITQLLHDAYSGYLSEEYLAKKRVYTVGSSAMSEAASLYRCLAPMANLPFLLTLGSCKRVLADTLQANFDSCAQDFGIKRSLSNEAASDSGGTYQRFLLPFAHQHYDPCYEDLSDIVDIPIFSRVPKANLSYSELCLLFQRSRLYREKKALASAQDNASLDELRAKFQDSSDSTQRIAENTSKVASFEAPTTCLLESYEVRDPTSWLGIATKHMVLSKYPSVVLRPDIMYYIPGCDLVQDGLGGIACGVANHDELAYDSSKTNEQLTEALQLQYAYTKLSDSDLATLYSTLGAVLQYMPTDDCVRGYVTTCYYTDSDGSATLIDSFIEVPSYSYYTAGKVMSACYSRPIVDNYDLLLSVSNLFTKILSSALEYSGFLTMSFVATSGIRRIESSPRYAVACPRFMYNGTSFGLTARILASLYLKLSNYTARHRMYMTSLGNKFFTRSNLASLRDHISAISPDIVSFSRYNDTINVIVGGKDADECLSHCNKAISLLQRESGCEEAIRLIVTTKVSTRCAQNLLEELGTTPFYVCGVNFSLHGRVSASPDEADHIALSN